MYIPNIVHTQGDSLGAGRTAVWMRQCQVKTASAMPYQAGEANENYFPRSWISPIQLESLKKLAP